MGILFDPEQSSVHYSRLATYCHVCFSLQRGVKPFLSDGYTNIYPLRMRLRTISMSTHVSQLFAGQNMASLHIVGSVVHWTAGCILVAITSGIIQLSLWIEPMVMIIVIGLVPTSPLEVLPTSLPSIVHSNWFWASFQTIEA